MARKLLRLFSSLRAHFRPFCVTSTGHVGQTTFNLVIPKFEYDINVYEHEDWYGLCGLKGFGSEKLISENHENFWLYAIPHTKHSSRQDSQATRGTNLN
jgi:hypothetical protein